MLRQFFIVGLVLSGLFAGMIALIPAFAPETAVLSYYELTPEYEEAIYLLDIRRGLSYFTGASYRRSERTEWSTDGNIITNINFSNTPMTFDLVYLNGDAPQSFDLASYPQLSPDGTKMAAVVGTDSNNSINIIDLLTGEETSFLTDLHINRLRWTPDGERLILNDNSGGGYITNTPYSIYIMELNTGVITPLFENIVFTYSTLTFNPLQLIFSRDNALFVSQVGEASDEARLIKVFDEPITWGLNVRPFHESQVVVTTGGEGIQRVWLVDINNGESEIIHEFQSGENYLRRTLEWSPDGNSAIKLTETSSVFSSFVISHDGQPDFNFTLQGEFGITYWSPDSRYIVILTNLTDYYLVDAVENSVTLLDVNIVRSLVWQPAPQ